MADIFTEEYRTYSDCISASAHNGLTGEPTDAELTNCISAHDFQLTRETPAKMWWQCEAYHPAIARALKVDRSQTGAVYALAPFRLFHDGEKHVILAAHPCPRILGPVDMDHGSIETVIAWNPVDDTAEAMGDQTPGLFGGEGDVVFRSPRDFFTQWMIERAAFYVRLIEARGNHWQAFADGDACPGKLAIGAIDKIQWVDLPREFEARGFDAAELNRAIIRQAKLPRAFSNEKKEAA